MCACVRASAQDSEASDSESDDDHMLIKPMFVSKRERDTVHEENTQAHEVPYRSVETRRQGMTSGGDCFVI